MDPVIATREVGDQSQTSSASPTNRSRWRSAPHLFLVALAAMLLAPAAHAARVTLSPAAGPAGSKVTLRGSGFAARATVHVSAAGRGRASAKTSARGKFQAVLRVPRAGRAIRLRSRAGSRQVVNV